MYLRFFLCGISIFEPRVLPAFHQLLNKIMKLRIFCVIFVCFAKKTSNCVLIRHFSVPIQHSFAELPLSQPLFIHLCQYNFSLCYYHFSLCQSLLPILLKLWTFSHCLTVNKKISKVKSRYRFTSRLFMTSQNYGMPKGKMDPEAVAKLITVKVWPFKGHFISSRSSENFLLDFSKDLSFLSQGIWKNEDFWGQISPKALIQQIKTSHDYSQLFWHWQSTVRESQSQATWRLIKVIYADSQSYWSTDKNC